MKQKILDVLQCPRCRGSLSVVVMDENNVEIRRGHLTCDGSPTHRYEIEDGIIHMATGFDHEAVQKEIEYEDSTYTGSDRLTDAKLIAQFPETLQELWPHTRHFGPDFKVLMEHLPLRRDSWVLDIGTGPCWSSRLLAQRSDNVIALDVNTANFYGLKTSDIMFAAHQVYFERILESMNNLPFRDDSIDCVTFNASFHHTPDHHRTLEECQRVLKPGGVVAMVNEEFESLRHRLFPPGEPSDTGSHHSIPYHDFERAIRNSGFQVSYFVAEHVKKKLPIPGAVALLEAFPILIKQMNSALIILRKPGQAPIPARQHSSQNSAVLKA